MIRKIIILLLPFLLILNCTGSKDQPSQAEKAFTEVTFWHAMGGPLGKVLDDLIKRFNETHPEIKIVPVGMGNYPALNTKLFGAINAGQPPTMAQAYEAWTSQFIDSKALTSMSHFIKGPNGLSDQEFNDILDVFIKGNTINGEMWSFPFNKSVRALYYNKDMFAEVGLNPDTPPATWEDYYNYALKLSKDTNGDGTLDIVGTAGNVSAWMFGNLLLQNEGSFMTADESEVAYQDQKGVEALEFLAKLLGRDSKVGHMTPGYDFQNEFLAGTVGIIEGSTVTTAYIEGKYDFKLGIAPIPAHKKKACIISGTNIVVFSKAPQEKQDAAWVFIKWFTSPEITAEWAARTGYMPVKKSAFETETMKKLFTEKPDLKAVYQQVDYAYYEPVSSAWFAGRKYLEENAIQSALKGLDDPKTALEKAANDTKEELQRLGN